MDTFACCRSRVAPTATLSNALFNAATGAGSFDCTFPDGDDSSTGRSRLRILMVLIPTSTPSW